MKSLAVLGSTGSIGRQTLEVVEANPDRYSVFSLSANTNIQLLEDQIKRFKPQVVAIADHEAAASLRRSLGNSSIKILEGHQGVEEAAASPIIDIVVVAVSGIAGLLPALAAIDAGKPIALANKESLVVAGDIVTKRARSKQVKIIPVDSEHSAIFQCLQGKKSEVEKLILTASGGPFRCSSREELDSVTPEMALAHPNWSMGKKISVDSATLMNKGLELIEAKWLFDIPLEKIDVLVHPQSIVHSMVEYIDGTVLANLGVPSMKIPIQYALSWPERIAANQHINFNEICALTFEAPRSGIFPCLELARSAGMAGGIFPAVLNAANEVAVQLFLERKIAFSSIPDLVRRTLDAFTNQQAVDIETVLEVDSRARKITAQLALNL